jgi:large subunit ribosomal protein L3
VTGFKRWPIAAGTFGKKANNMSLGLVGRKVGMTRVFTDDGDTIPVTVVDVSNNRVTQIKTPETDGYAAVQVAYGKRRSSRVNKAAAGHFAKAGVEAGHTLREFRIKPDEVANLKVGGAVGTDIFKVGQKVDVSGTSQGKGFAGVIKRHHFSSNRASHGNSVSHNKPGSIGMNQDPGRVFPGKRMAGHMGAASRTVQNLEIIRIDAERQLLLISGALPGSRGGDVTVKPTVRATRIAAPGKPVPAKPAAAAKPAASKPAAAAKPAKPK